MSEETTTTEGQSEAAATETPAIPDATEAPRAAEALRALMQQEKATREARQSNIEHEAVVRQSKALQQLAQADPVGFLERSGIKREDISQRLSEGADPVSDMNKQGCKPPYLKPVPKCISTSKRRKIRRWYGQPDQRIKCGR